MRHTGEKSFYFEVYLYNFYRTCDQFRILVARDKLSQQNVSADSMEVMVIELAHKEVLLIRCPGLRRHIRK